MFYKGKIPLFSEKCGFQPPIFIGKVYFGFLWALLICLFIINVFRGQGGGKYNILRKKNPCVV